MKKLNKFLLALGSVASLASMPLIAAKCGGTKEEAKKPEANDPNANNSQNGRNKDNNSSEKNNAIEEVLKENDDKFKSFEAVKAKLTKTKEELSKESSLDLILKDGKEKKITKDDLMKDLDEAIKTIEQFTKNFKDEVLKTAKKEFAGLEDFKQHVQNTIDDFESYLESFWGDEIDTLLLTPFEANTAKIEEKSNLSQSTEFVKKELEKIEKIKVKIEKFELKDSETFLKDKKVKKELLEKELKTITSDITSFVSQIQEDLKDVEKDPELINEIIEDIYAFENDYLSTFWDPEKDILLLDAFDYL
ncbi:Hypothetical protein, predicted lipoprotein [Metamycoplasma auris 15026]|uniref:Uncharacterized protein n=1 Tax=Metamycoplasma auris 15026 TaxID=1188233 RepID=N9VBM3_9BACT|nr:variable surface lipoprotein [Metamycoplasma auris]ENY69083.1 Hypothetical protein, predicted lipoprotein [Metamycoplasma auris 15026]